MDINAGLVAIAFWGFIAVCVASAVWDTIKKRETKHETLRRFIESGQPIDEALLEKLDLIGTDDVDRHDRAFKITALWLLPIAAGLFIFGGVMSFINVEASVSLMGVSALLTCMGVGCLIGERITRRWYD